MIGSAAAATVICLPFFAAAPTAMWNQIVRDQLFRRGRRSGVTILERLDEMAGLGIVDRSLPTAITVAAVVALLCCAALAWSYREARLAVLLMLGQGLFLLVTPTWFAHSAGFTAAPVALTGGAAIGRLTRAAPSRIRTDRGWCPRRRRAARVRERLGNSHLQPPVPRSLPSVHRCHPRMRHLR